MFPSGEYRGGVRAASGWRPVGRSVHNVKKLQGAPRFLQMSMWGMLIWQKPPPARDCFTFCRAGRSPRRAEASRGAGPIIFDRRYGDEIRCIARDVAR